MRDLPNGWNREKIVNLCIKPQYGYTSKSTNKQNKNPKYLRTTDITKEEFSWDTVPYCILPVKNEENYLIKEGDIFVTRAGSVGENILIKDKPPRAVFASYLIRIKPLEKINNFYLSYYFKSPFFWKYIVEEKDGVTTPNVNAQKLANIEFPYPESTEEQRLIVQEIEKQFTRLDDAVKELREVKKKLEVYRKSVLKAAFDIKGNEFTFKEVCKLINGRAFKPREWSTKGIPIIRIQNLNDKLANFNYCNFKVDYKYYINTGDLLFAWSGTPGTSFGAHIWNRGNAVLNQHIFKVILDSTRINKKFLMHYINKNLQEYIIKAHGTAGLAHITKGKFEESIINLPEIEKQKEIVSEIESRFSVIDKIEEVINNALLKTEQLRKSILKSAFEGKLVKYEGDLYV